METDVLIHRKEFKEIEHSSLVLDSFGEPFRRRSHEGLNVNIDIQDLRIPLDTEETSRSRCRR